MVKETAEAAHLHHHHLVQLMVVHWLGYHPICSCFLTMEKPRSNPKKHLLKALALFLTIMPVPNAIAFQPRVV
jgi:hypothetical protein